MATEPIINADEIVKHWTDTSDADFEVMLTLLEAKQKKSNNYEYG